MINLSPRVKTPQKNVTSQDTPSPETAIITEVASPIIKKVAEERGFFAGLFDYGTGFLASVAGVGLSQLKTWDETILPSILLDPTDLTVFLKEMAPKLLAFISPLLFEGIQNFLKDRPTLGEQFIDTLLSRIITNLSLSLFSDEIRKKIEAGASIPKNQKIPLDKLGGLIFDKLIHLIGKDLNAVDEKVFNQKEKLDAKLFRPTMEKVYELLFPPGDGFRLGLIGQYFNIKDELVKKGSEGCLDLYCSLLKKGGGESPSAALEIPLDLTPLQAGIGRILKYFNKEFRTQWEKEDQKLFHQLTGAEDFCSFMEKSSPQLYEQLSQFLPKDLFFQDNRQSLEESTSTFLRHMIASLAKEVFQKELREGKTVTSEELIEKSISYFAAKIQAQFEIVHQKQAKGGTPVASDFASISGDIIKIFLPKIGSKGEYQWLHALVDRRQKELTEPLHDIFLSLYLSQPAQGKVEEYKERLRGIFAGETSSNDAVNAFHQLSSNLATMIRNQIASPLKDSGRIFEELGKDSKEIVIANKLSSGIQAAFQGGDSSVSWFEKQMQQSLEYMIFRGIVHVFEKVPPEDRHPPGRLFMHLFQKMLTIVEKHLPQISNGLELQRGKILLEIKSGLSNPKSGNYIGDKEKRRIVIDQEVSKRLEILGTQEIQPFLDEFMGLFFENEHETLEDQIPVMGGFNNPLCKEVRLALSKQFSKILVVTMSWMQDRKKNETRLGELYPSKNPVKLCNVLGHMAREGLSSYLRKDHVSLTNEIIMPFLKPYFSPSTSAQTNTADLSYLHQMLQGFFLACGNQSSPIIQKLMDFIGDFADTTLLRLVADFSKRIKTMELESARGEKESLMEGIIVRLFEQIRAHFNVIGKITEGKRQLTREQLIAGFAREGKLHPAVPEGPAKENFFKNLSHQVFQIIGISDKSYLPIPDFLKTSVWRLIENKLIPLMLVLATNAAKDPSNLNKMIIASLQNSVDAAKQDEDSVLARLFPDEDAFDKRLKSYEPRFKDAYQTKLEKRIGGVMDALIQPRKGSIPRSLLNIKIRGNRVFHSKTASVIGQTFRSIFRDEKNRPVSTLDLLNIAMGLIADSVVEVEWSERAKKIVYPKTGFDGKKVVGDGAKYVQRPTLTRFFPKTDQEKTMASALERRERKRAEKEVPYYLRKIISIEAKRLIKDKFLQSWDLFEAKFKKNSPTLSKVLVPMLTFLVKLPILVTVVFFLDVCVWCIVNAILKLVLSKQIEKYAQDTNVDVYDNVIYQILEYGMGKIAEGIGTVYAENEEAHAVT